MFSYSPVQPMLCKIVKDANERITWHPRSGISHFAYFVQSVFAIAREPIRVPAVGKRQLEKPSPNWNACTATCLVMPARSATGTISGITAAACPEPDGIKRLINRFATNIKFAPRMEPIPDIGMDSQ